MHDSWEKIKMEFIFLILSFIAHTQDDYVRWAAIADLFLQHHEIFIAWALSPCTIESGANFKVDFFLFYNVMA